MGFCSSDDPPGIEADLGQSSADVGNYFDPLLSEFRVTSNLGDVLEDSEENVSLSCRKSNFVDHYLRFSHRINFSITREADHFLVDKGKGMANSSGAEVPSRKRSRAEFDGPCETPDESSSGYDSDNILQEFVNFTVDHNTLIEFSRFCIRRKFTFQDSC